VSPEGQGLNPGRPDRRPPLAGPADLPLVGHRQFEGTGDFSVDGGHRAAAVEDEPAGVPVVDPGLDVDLVAVQFEGDGRRRLPGHEPVGERVVAAGLGRIERYPKKEGNQAMPGLHRRRPAWTG
jgi:hypothetical protein